MKKETGIFGGKSEIIIKGTVIGLLVFLGFMLAFAGIMLALDTDRAYAAPFATVSIAAGCFAAAYYTAFKNGNRGYLVGLAVGGVVFAVVTAVSLAVCKDGVTMNTLFHFLIFLLSAVAGGIAGVNKSKDKKYI